MLIATPGDDVWHRVYMRIFGQSLIGKFIIADEWTPLPKRHQKWATLVAGTFPMRDVEVWKHPIPSSLIFSDLSNQNHRMRIAQATIEDITLIEAARKICARLGLGSGDGEIVVLERGLEEAIKPSLPKMGLRLAAEAIRQQCFMGIGAGRSDLVCLDESGDLVVIELKRGMSSDEVVGQVLSYVGWLRENVATNGQNVKGMIVTGDYDERLRLAAKAAGIKVVLVRLG